MEKKQKKLTTVENINQHTRALNKMIFDLMNYMTIIKSLNERIVTLENIIFNLGKMLNKYSNTVNNDTGIDLKIGNSKINKLFKKEIMFSNDDLPDVNKSILQKEVNNYKNITGKHETNKND